MSTKGWLAMWVPPSSVGVTSAPSKTSIGPGMLNVGSAKSKSFKREHNEDRIFDWGVPYVILDIMKMSIGISGSVFFTDKNFMDVIPYTKFIDVNDKAFTWKE